MGFTHQVRLFKSIALRILFFQVLLVVWRSYRTFYLSHAREMFGKKMESKLSTFHVQDHNFTIFLQLLGIIVILLLSYAQLYFIAVILCVNVRICL